MMTTLVRANKGELERHIRDLSEQQFVSFLEQLKEEFNQFFQIMNMLKEHDMKDNLERVIKTLILKIGQILQADQTTIFLVDEAKGQLWSKIAQDNGEEPLEPRTPINVGIAGYVATTWQYSLPPYF